MKKLLALVLALVMTLGLATVSTSAAYTDADDIDYTEAADVMTAVGVFQGKGDAFAPKDNLNRAEAAKLVAYLMLGNKTAESMTGSGTRFTDVPASHWAAGFIEYLASVGIVSGVGGGQFNPNGQVTAVQFAKMLLVALGYDAELENFVGDGWSINIQKVANENDLFKGLDLSANDALTREQAAQMCLNDLKADMVEYADKGTTVKIGESTVVTGAKKAEEKEEKNNHDYNNGNAHDKKYQQLVEFLYGDDLKLTGTSDDMYRPANQWKYKTKDVGTYANTGDLIFEAKGEVKRTKVYEIIGKTAADDLLANYKNDGKNKDNARFAVYVDGADMFDAFVAGTSGTKASPYASVLVDKNTTAAIGTPSTTGNKDTSDWLHYGAQFTGNGSTTQIYLQEDYNDGTDTYDLYTIVITNEYLVKATADYSSSREEVNVEWKTLQPWDTVTVKGGKDSFTCPTENTISQEDFDVSGVKKDDYLVVTYSQKEDSFQSVKAATTLEGEITKYVLNDTVTIDGTLYKYAKKVQEDEKGQTFSVGNKVVMITDGEFILRVDDANATKDFVYLQDLGSNDGLKNNVKAAVYTTAGTLRTVDVKKITTGSKSELTASQLKAGYCGGDTTEASLYGWYTYSVGDDGAYTLKKIDSAFNTTYNYATLTYALNAKALDLKITDGKNVKFLTNQGGSNVNIKANNKTVFIVLDRNEDITVYTGLTNAPSITLKAGANAYVSYVNDDGFATYVFVDLSNTTKTNVSIDDTTLSDDYMMIVKLGKANYDEKDNEKVYKPHTVLSDGEIVTKNFDNEPVATFTKGVLYHKIKTNNNDYITDAEAITDADKKDYVWGENIVSDGYKISFYEKTLTIGGQGYLLNSDDCVYLILDLGSEPAKDKKLDYTPYLKISGAALESYLKGYQFNYNYYGVRHDEDSATLDALYVWVTTYDASAWDGKALSKTSGSYVLNDDLKLNSATAITDTANTDGEKLTVYINGELDTNGKKFTIDGAAVHVDSIKGLGDVEVANGGELYVDGALTIGGLKVDGCTVEVNGTATFNGAVTINGKDETANVTFNGPVEAKSSVTLGADSKTTFAAKLDVASDLEIKAGAEGAIKSDVTVGNDLKVNASTVTLEGSTEAKNLVVTDAKVTIGGETEISGNFTVTASKLTVDAPVSVGNTFTAKASDDKSTQSTVTLASSIVAADVVIDDATTVAVDETVSEDETVSVVGTESNVISEDAKIDEEVKQNETMADTVRNATEKVTKTAKAYTDALTANKADNADDLATAITDAAAALTEKIEKATKAEDIEKMVAEDTEDVAGATFWNAIKAAGAAISKKLVDKITTVDSRARWSDGGEVFTKDPTTSPDWDARLGGDLAKATAEIDESSYAYDAENKVSYATVKVTLADEDAMAKHYNAAGKQGYWYGLSLAAVKDAQYALTTNTEANVKELTYKDAHWTDGKTVSMYPNVTDEATKFMLVVKVGDAYTAYVLDFSGVANGVNYEFNFKGVTNAWSRLTSGDNTVTQIWKDGKAVPAEQDE